MSNTMVNALGNVGHAGSAGKHRVDRAAASSWSTLFEAAKRAGSAAESEAGSAWSTVFQAAKVVLGVRSALQVMGIDVVALLRRRGPLGPVSVFGAGVAVGAGIGALLAPMDGKAARRALRRRFRELRRDALGQVEEVGAQVKDIEHKVEEKASEVAGAAKSQAESIAHDVTKEAASRAKPSAPRKGASSSGASRSDGARPPSGHVPIKWPHFFG